MDKRFADWYTLVSPVPPPDLLPHRWSAVENLVKFTTSVKDVIALVDFVVSDEPSSTGAATVEGHLKTGDESLPVKNRFEARV